MHTRARTPRDRPRGFKRLISPCPSPARPGSRDVVVVRDFRTTGETVQPTPIGRPANAAHFSPRARLLRVPFSVDASPGSVRRFPVGRHDSSRRHRARNHRSSVPVIRRRSAVLVRIVYESVEKLSCNKKLNLFFLLLICVKNIRVQKNKVIDHIFYQLQLLLLLLLDYWRRTRVMCGRHNRYDYCFTQVHW
jgi:hypothetical protein